MVCVLDVLWTEDSNKSEGSAATKRDEGKDGEGLKHGDIF